MKREMNLHDFGMALSMEENDLAPRKRLRGKCPAAGRC